MAELTQNYLPVESAELLQPDDSLIGLDGPSVLAHRYRESRLLALPEYGDIRRTLVARRMMEGSVDDLGFLTPDGIRDTFDGTQLVGENHRRLAPRMQEMLHFSDTSDLLMSGIDAEVLRSTERVLRQAESTGGFLTYDVAILGAGPHGTAAAMNIRERFPDLSILMVDATGLGGLWTSNGPNASYWMNSRVRKADGRLAPIPRTPGNINPLGRYAMMELSDVVKGNYALNTEMGRLTKLNGFMAATDTLIGSYCDLIVDQGDGAYMRLTNPDGSQINLQSAALINATGIEQQSALNPTEDVQTAPWYFNSKDFYQYIGNADRKPGFRPLERFHKKDVVIVGAGDAALTALEALLGNLPSDTYGSYGVGRYRPNSITWIGAPGTSAQEIEQCLRSRYKNGIIQALPKNQNDQGSIILAFTDKARRIEPVGNAFNLRLESGAITGGDILIDCSNQKALSYGPLILDRRGLGVRSAIRSAGPGAGRDLPPATLQTIADLGIGENTAALWALMPLTDLDSFYIGRVAQENLRLAA